MIDFAHTETSEEPQPAPYDSGYLEGLRTLIECVPLTPDAHAHPGPSATMGGATGGAFPGNTC
jgi:hypothetical protein